MIILGLNRIYSSEFINNFNGTIIIDQDIETKLDIKHKVYKDDLIDGLGDPYLVVMKPKQKSLAPTNKVKSKGKLFEILCETESGKILFLVGRLFPDGNLYVITAYWAGLELQAIYLQESEALKDD